MAHGWGMHHLHEGDEVRCGLVAVLLRYDRALLGAKEGRLYAQRPGAV